MIILNILLNKLYHFNNLEIKSKILLFSALFFKKACYIIIIEKETRKKEVTSTQIY
jgi:hypothetical protein